MKPLSTVCALLLCGLIACPALFSGEDKSDEKPDARNDVMQWQAKREKNSPKVGDTAPDFERPILDMNAKDGEKKSGEKSAMFKLSSFKDRAGVVLVFASFT